ncbi:hypothetical protein DES34_10239 [Brevibacillus brevis]|nr:hypothetical protein DES34_10239 [Brevibacillus brevis]VEF92556.1 Uncharacterised protein [Brevibacillus brevis]
MGVYMDNMFPSFLYNFWKVIFQTLQKVTLFDILRTFIPYLKNSKYKYVFVELWVVLNVLISFISVIFIHNVTSDNFQLLKLILLVYGIYRVFEINITQLNLMLFSDGIGEVRSYKRTIILLLHNYVEIVLWFTLSYLYFSSEFKNVDTKSFVEIIYISLVTMASFQSALMPGTSMGYYLVSFQTVTGLLLTLISLARFIPLLANPKSIDRDESITNRDLEEYKHLCENLMNQVKKQDDYIKRLEEREKSIIAAIKEIEQSKRLTASAKESD